MGASLFATSPQQCSHCLKDPFVIEAYLRESFRLLVVDLLDQNKSPIKDFKQIADARPKKNKSPSAIPRSQNPKELTDQELIDYIIANYDLGGSFKTKKYVLPANQVIENPQIIDDIISNPIYKKLPNRVLFAVRKAHTMWLELLRYTPNDQDSLLGMKNPCVVSGGRFEECYFWDTYWIMKGLIISGYGDIAKGMFENFIELFERFGIIGNGNRYYYLTRTQVPLIAEMAKLLVSNNLLNFNKNHSYERILDLVAANPKDLSLELRTLRATHMYYQNIWKGTDRYLKSHGLFRYSDDAGGSKDPNLVVLRPERGIKEPLMHETHSKRTYAELGWDMVYSRFGGTPFIWSPVELNSILFGYTQHFSQWLSNAGFQNESQEYKLESEKIKKRMEAHLVDSNGNFNDYNTETHTVSEVQHAGIFFSFFYKLYENTSEVRNRLQTLFRKLKPKDHLGLHSTELEGMGQWDGSWSWAPLNEVAFQSLLNYGLINEATELAFDFSLMVLKHFYKSGYKFLEKYRGKDGSIKIPENSEIYGNEEGFGWTNATLLVFLKYLDSKNLLGVLERRLQEEIRKEISAETLNN